ncbi:MAG TPA: trigger factor [Candidatus Bathyarchaeia archaeon]|nr:trigger factor [Candidatus Bathyarchaeia archaeon]
MKKDNQGEKPQKTATKSLSQSKVERLKNGNVEITITIPWDAVAESYNITLGQFTKDAKIKGFRPGKAPEKLVEKTIGKSKIYQEMIKNLLTDVYLEAIKTHKLSPVVNPKFNLIDSKEGQDWTLKAIVAELPPVELKDYKEEIRKTLAPEKIWVPGKDPNVDKKEGQPDDKKLSRIFSILIKTVNISLPEILLEQEITRMLSRLIDQTARLGITVEQYLASIGKTLEQLKGEYRTQAEESLKLELILSEIANRENIQVSDQEVDEMIKATGNEKIQKNFQTATEKAYIRQILRKRKAIDILSKI